MMETNADRKEGGFYVWEGGLKEGERRHMKVYCDKETFRDANMVEWAPVSDSPGEQQIHTFANAPLFINRRNYFHSPVYRLHRLSGGLGKGLVCQRPGILGPGKASRRTWGTWRMRLCLCGVCLCLRLCRRRKSGLQ